GRGQYVPGRRVRQRSACQIEQLRGRLRGPWRQGLRAVMVLLSLHGLPTAEIAVLLECHPSTVRRWTGRFNAGGDGRAGRPAALRAAPAGRALPAPADRRAGAAARSVDGAAALALPEPADAVPAGAAGRGLAAAEADRPRRPGT